MAGIESPTTGNGVEVNATQRAMRISDYPNEVGGWLSVGAQSGAVTATAALAPLFSFRNLSTKLILVRRIGVGLIATTGFTAAQKVDLGLILARSFTVSDSGGTAIALTGSNAKHRTSLNTPSSVDMRIATTGALTAGTRTLDTNQVAQTGGFVQAAALGVLIQPGPSNLFGHDPGDYPLVLAQNEGLIIQSLTAFGAGGVASFYANIEFAESDTF
jgi:hypothetical protein